MIKKNDKKPDGDRVLRIDFLRRGDVRELINALWAVENFYNHVSFFEIIVGAVNREMGIDDLEAPGLRATFQRLANIQDIENYILPEERLQLVRISIQSPGFLDVLGKLNVLETVRQYIGDCHERRKDRDYRSNAEADKLWIENQKSKTELMKDQVDLFRDIGLPDEFIRRAVMQHLVEPTDRIDQMQDSGFMGGAHLTLDPPSNQHRLLEHGDECPD